jgi:hypothetical protein
MEGIVCQAVNTAIVTLAIAMIFNPLRMDIQGRFRLISSF